MRRLQVSEIGFAAPVNLKHRYLAGIVLVGHRIQRQHARLQPNGGFDLFCYGRLVSIKLGRIDDDFGDLNMLR
jgi:hypothetical protein